MKRLLWIMVLVLLLIGSVAAKQKVELGIDYSIVCEQDEYKVFTGSTYAKCWIDYQGSKDYDITGQIVLEKSRHAMITNILYPDLELGWTKAIDQKSTKVNKWEGKQISKKVKNKERLYFLIEIRVIDNSVDDEFWIFLDSESGEKVTLDPPVTGCNDTDPAFIICANGTFTGNYLDTTKNIIIDNATLDGYNATGPGLLRLNTTGNITILNSILNGSGSTASLAGDDGNCMLIGSNLDLDNVLMDCYGSKGANKLIIGDGYDGGDGSVTITSSVAEFYNVTINNYAGAGGTGPGAGGVGGSSASVLTITTFTSYLWTSNSYGGAGGSDVDGGVSSSEKSNGGTASSHIYSTNLNISLSTLNSYGGAGGLGLQNTPGGHGVSGSLSIHSTYTDLNNVSINSYGGIGRNSVQEEAGNGGNGNIVIHSTSLQIRNDSDLDAHGGNAGDSTADNDDDGDGGDAYLILNATSYTILNTTINTDRGLTPLTGVRIGSHGDSKADYRAIDRVNFVADTISMSGPASTYNKINFTDFTTSIYILAVVNATDFEDNTYIYCDIPNRLYIINDSSLDANLINGNCGPVSYLNESYYNLQHLGDVYQSQYATMMVEKNTYTFDVDIVYNTSISTMVINFLINGSQYSPSLTSDVSIGDLKNQTYTYYYTAPNVNQHINITLGFNITFSNANLTLHQPLYYNATIYDVKIDRCNATISNPILNISHYDEIDYSSLSLKNTYALAFREGSSNISVSGIVTASENLTICSNLPTTLDYGWNMTGTFALSKAGYVTRVFTIDTTAGLPIRNDEMYNLSLYLIGIGNSSTISYVWQTTEFQGITGTMLLYRCNDDGTKSLINSIPVVGGSAAANIELLTQLYAYKIIIDGTTYQDASFYTCHVETSTSKSYYVDTGTSEVLPVLGLFLIDCFMEKVATNVVSMRWNANAGDSSNITGCIVASRQSPTGAMIEIYRNCTEGTTGSFTRTIPTTEVNYYIRGILYQNDNIGICRDVIIFAQETDSVNKVGIMGLLMVALLIMAGALIYVGEGMKQILAAIGAIGISGLIGYTNFPWPVTSAIIFFLLIVALVARYTRQK